jgi:hypothetical protein
MSSITSLQGSVPAELIDAAAAVDQEASSTHAYGDDSKLINYVTTWRSKLSEARRDKQNIWDECWQLYRGLEDFREKQDWQSKIVVPKAWASVKQGVSFLKRILQSAERPWQHEAVNPDDLVQVQRSTQITDLVQYFMDRASYIEAFAEGLECGLITGVGVWKMWWGMVPRMRTRVETLGQVEGQMFPQRRLVREEIMEGRLHINAVDPYNFYWLPGSKFNRFVGTIEEIEIPKWELLMLADQGVFDKELVKNIQPSRVNERDKQSYLRFSERPNLSSGANADTDIVKLTEFYGPIVQEGQLLTQHGHCVIANDTTKLVSGENEFWHRKPPYVAFSPLMVPFRTDGMGLLEMVRQIDKALSRLTNLSVDTLLYRLMPLFEVNLGVFENQEDFETGLFPGKIFRRNSSFIGQPGITPVKFDDISNGTIQTVGSLDRAHQEGSLISEIQEGLPRFRGVQTATEVKEKSANQDSFFGNMAGEIEKNVLLPMVEMCSDLVLQYIDTANDPRVASILGVGIETLRGMSREELIELVQGDYEIKVTGITSQIEKSSMLENIVQLLNILGQSPETWMPYVKQDELLRRVLEAFRPSIRDIDNIVAEPALVAARQAQMQEEKLTPEIIVFITQMIQQQLETQKAQQAALQAQQAAEAQAAQIALVEREMQVKEKQAEADMVTARAKVIGSVK